MENPIVWALIATLGTWAVTAAGAATVFLFRRPSPEATVCWASRPES